MRIRNTRRYVSFIVVAAVILTMLLAAPPKAFAVSETGAKEAGEYAYYGFHEVEQTPLLRFDFDDAFSKSDVVTNSGSAEGNGRLSNAQNAALIKGRYDLGQALDLTGGESCLTAPDLGETDALTISFWVKLRDVQTRANADEPRVTYLLDTAAGNGRVSLKLVHTGTPPKPIQGSNEMDQGDNNTKLVFCVEGNEGGAYGESGVYANNQRYYEYEYTFAAKAQSWTSHLEEHCWIHVAVVYEPSENTVTFYNSGKLDSVKRFTLAQKPVLNGILIGGGYEEGQHLDGAIDDVQIYDKALNAQDIEALADFERDMWAYRAAGSWHESSTVIYVDGTNGDDNNPGTVDAPFATVKKGVEAVQGPGTRVVIAPGLYREAGITLRHSGTELMPIIIEAEQPGKTIICGSSVLTDWQMTTLRDVYAHEWKYSFPIYGSSGNEFATRTDMLYIDGQPMEPVFSLEELKLNSYYVSDKTDKVYVMTRKTLGNFVAEVPDLGVDEEQNKEAFLLNADSNEYIVLRGLAFTDCATTIHSGMVKMGTAQHVIIEDCSFNKSNGQGLEFESGWGSRIAKDIVIRRCSFDNNGYGAVSAGFRTMNLVIEACEFTNTGWKVDWGKYTAADPATMKMMFVKNVIVRRCRFDHNHDNDLWFDNYNWNIDIVGNSFANNHSEIAVHTEINPFGVQIRNNVGGGLRIGNSEGTIVTGNLFFARSHPLITHWGFEVRYDGNNQGKINMGGPGLSWKDTILENNLFVLAKDRTKIFDLPPYESFFDMTASGNRYYIERGKASDKVFSVLGSRMDYAGFSEVIGDETAVYLSENPFLDDGSASVQFKDALSLSSGVGISNYVPVVLSKPLRKEVSVSYILRDYDTGEELGSGVLKFDPYNTEKVIYTGDGNSNVTVELLSAKDIRLGEGTTHIQFAASKTVS